MTREQEIEARLKAATPGPWDSVEDADGNATVLSESDAIAVVSINVPNDAKLIASAPADLRYLLGRVAELEWLRDTILRDKLEDQGIIAEALQRETAAECLRMIDKAAKRSSDGVRIIAMWPLEGLEERIRARFGLTGPVKAAVCQRCDGSGRIMFTADEDTDCLGCNGTGRLS